jgi:hypothetical protein
MSLDWDQSAHHMLPPAMPRKQKSKVKLEREFEFTIANKTSFPVRVNIFVHRAMDAGAPIENFEFIIMPCMQLQHDLVSCGVPGLRLLGCQVSQGWQRVLCHEPQIFDPAVNGHVDCFAMSIRAVSAKRADEPGRLRMRLYAASRHSRKKLFEEMSQRHEETDYSYDQSALPRELLIT